MINPKWKNIVISGDIGTGTSTLGKKLAEGLSWRFVSAGDFFRQYHLEHDIPLWNKSQIPNDIEKKIDSSLFEKVKKGEGYIVESHYGGWFARKLPEVFKILLVCEKSIAAERVQKRKHTHKETIDEIEERRNQLKAKFNKLYSNEDYFNSKFFNIVIDTGKNDIEEMVKKSLSALSS